MQKKKERKRDKVINKKRHPSIWTDRSKWREMGIRNTVTVTAVA